MQIKDAHQRAQALDPRQSFIVQAPAGSGKTELLTQRFLKLLATVKQPEEILAITFTKKSAAEMRSRIIHALQTSLHTTPPEAAHAKTTYVLAQHVLEMDQKLQWNLIENPNRLRIQTMDAFNTYLTKQLPILSNFGATPDISDDFYKLYEEAVYEFLSHLEENFAWSSAIEKLLLHLDNDIFKVAKLLIDMLAKRDQWLPYVTMDAHHTDIKSHLESYLKALSLDAIQEVYDKFPKSLQEEATFLASYAGQHVKRQGVTSKLANCADLAEFPLPTTENKNIWLGFAELFLTKDFGWRKRIDKNLGFPPATAFQNPVEKKLAALNKERITQLISALTDNESLRFAFENLCLTPPTYFDDSQWETLEALYLVLRVVVAQLRLTFQKYGKIDYTENSLAALQALGDEDSPTDLNLILDYQLKHILIDEFQDTSNNQYRLIERLMTGWQQNDGRTLFLVGDPMQSIYRFREAEVGLFIRTQLNGLGPIKLTSLILEVNFRSKPSVVNWVNDHFQHVLPKIDDISLGAVSYSPSIACAEEQNSFDQAVQLHPQIDVDQREQALKIVNLIQSVRQKNVGDKIAILVRSRSHLIHILPALKAAHIAYRAIDIDPLDARPVIQDLLALSAALLHPADRVAWLSVLRAPWCGLSLADLSILSEDYEGPILQRLINPQVLTKLSTDGHERINRILSVLTIKTKERQRTSLRLWVESTWLLLGGPAAVTHQSDLDDASSYFALLDKYAEESDSIQIYQIKKYVNQLFAAPDPAADDTLQIMTIHNSKGLEFDVVILPHLEKKPPNDKTQLLLWLEQTRKNNAGSLIIAPMRGIGQVTDPIYEYIHRQHAIKSDFESGRLLYVAATRAKKALHLFFSLKTDPDKSDHSFLKPAAKSLLDKLWSSISNELAFPNNIAFKPSENTIEDSYYLHRLHLQWQHPLPYDLSEEIFNHKQKMGFYLPPLQAKYLGTLLHGIFQQLSLYGQQWWKGVSDINKKTYIQQYLTRVGFSETEVLEAENTVYRAVDNILNDSHGQWILKPHAEAQNEFPITANIEGKIQSLIIDRTFVENDVRWIIDYKTTVPKDLKLSQFLRSESEKYKTQLMCYAHAFKGLENRHVKLGLYFPLIPAWIEVFAL